MFACLLGQSCDFHYFIILKIIIQLFDLINMFFDTGRKELNHFFWLFFSRLKFEADSLSHFLNMIRNSLVFYELLKLILWKLFVIITSYTFYPILIFYFLYFSLFSSEIGYFMVNSRLGALTNLFLIFM